MTVPSELKIVETLTGEASVQVRSKGKRIAWRPGEAVLVAPNNERDALTAAVKMFDQFDTELQKLQLVLWADAERAALDAESAYDVRHVDPENRERMRRLMKGYGRMRVEFAALNAALANVHLNGAARRWFDALVRKSKFEERAETFSDQLEVREELYEGAVDRFADAAGWAAGHKLEVIIVVLLMIEIAVNTAELILNHFRD